MILTASDDDVAEFGMERSISIMEKCFRERCIGSFESPPRMHVELSDGQLVFTPGGSRSEHTAGFRVYTTFPEDHQITVVYNSAAGHLVGLVEGSLLGAYRTASIGALSIKYMSNSDSESLGIVGSGVQAFHQAIAALRVRSFSAIYVHSRNPDHLHSFAERLRIHTDIPIYEMGSADEVVAASDVIITATRSSTPLFSPQSVRKGTHIVAVGRKSAGSSEIDPAVADKCSVLATDSPVQLENYDPPHIMAGRSVIDLAHVVCGKHRGRFSRQDVTMFLSVGLSGTEVMLARAVLERKMK
ncbi:MAG: hypothetical protein QXN26_00940 [Thermoplasmataceae archaeon]